MSNPIKNAKLNTREVKNLILKYLHSSGINLNTKFEMISSEKDLNNIRDNEYIICPRITGTRSWIILFHVDENYYAVSFPKHSQHKREDIRIFPIDITMGPEFYRGTIMEGIFFRMDEKRLLIIDEVYVLAGENQLLKPKDDRLNYLSEYFKRNININQNFLMYVSQYYTLTKSSLKELYEKIKADPKIQDIIFYPKLYSQKIYSYTIIDIDLIDNIIKLAQFIMEKTANPDVYNLYALTTKNKIDIAYIPDMATSKKCKQWFKDNKAIRLIVKCQLDNDKKKWIPIEMIEQDIEHLEDETDDATETTESNESEEDQCDLEAN